MFDQKQIAASELKIVLQADERAADDIWIEMILYLMHLYGFLYGPRLHRWLKHFDIHCQGSKLNAYISEIFNFFINLKLIKYY
ncbi:unnamed protein product [Blepharisma stoltei]|uniref:Uncharacterized protein n=1 Tax=Blepharisma stoltei TaxID=1481888 RepID=A0AAU9IHV8_9CILI|nr:unnamed protein product [Blepharisma stoltei]